MCLESKLPNPVTTASLIMPPSTSIPVEAPYTEAVKDRNPHRDFPAVEASRPDYDTTKSWTYTKTRNPQWTYGSGASDTEWENQSFTDIDPNEPGRPTNLNYKLMISSTVPRPIALLSTLSKDGTQNLAPFSYFQAVSSDPPVYMVSFVGEAKKDSLLNLLQSKEACISLISDSYVEAANATSINTPPGVSEWPLAGLHPRSSQKVAPPHVAESPFSIELKYYSHQDILSPKTGQRTATMVLLEAVLYHARSDAVGADRATIDIAKLQPCFRAGGITYGICFDGFELLRPEAFRKVREREDVKGLIGDDDRIGSGRL